VALVEHARAARDGGRRISGRAPERGQVEQPVTVRAAAPAARRPPIRGPWNRRITRCIGTSKAIASAAWRRPKCGDEVEAAAERLADALLQFASTVAGVQAKVAAAGSPGCASDCRGRVLLRSLLPPCA